MKQILKRAIDLAAATVGLVILAAPLAVIAVAIRLDSPGPALFRQRRVGLHGRTFDILKFRTMRPDAPALGPAITIGADPRITRLGHVLRRLKLDELPQIINVLKGEMALVGPRPEVPYYIDKYTIEQRRAILSVKPGITDYASVHFRRESEFLSRSTDPEHTYITVIMPKKYEFYRYYIDHNSVLTDFRILFQTFLAVAGLGGLIREPDLGR